MLKVDTRYALMRTECGEYNGETFYVDFVLDKDSMWFQAFLWNDDFITKELVFESSIRKCRRGECLDDQIERFINLVERNFDTYVKAYLDKYMSLEKKGELVCIRG